MVNLSISSAIQPFYFLFLPSYTRCKTLEHVESMFFCQISFHYIAKNDYNKSFQLRFHVITTNTLLQVTNTLQSKPIIVNNQTLISQLYTLPSRTTIFSKSNNYSKIHFIFQKKKKKLFYAILSLVLPKEGRSFFFF